MSKLYASIDIGTNSALLLVATVEENRIVSKLQKISPCRIFESISNEEESKARFDEQALKDVLIGFRQTLHNVNATIMSVVLTQAARKVEDPEVLLEFIKKILFFRPEIISGQRESELTWNSINVVYNPDRLITVDIGAGSTEISNGLVSQSYPIGALVLKNKFGSTPSSDIHDFITETFKELPLEEFQGDVFLTGGTATTLAMLEKNLKEFKMENVEGTELSLEAPKQWIKKFGKLSMDIISQMPTVGKKRAEIITPGLHIIHDIVHLLKASMFTVSTMGLRYGALQEQLEKAGIIKHENQ